MTKRLLSHSEGGVDLSPGSLLKGSAGQGGMGGEEPKIVSYLLFPSQTSRRRMQNL